MTKATHSPDGNYFMTYLNLDNIVISRYLDIYLEYLDLASQRFEASITCISNFLFLI